jgi:basic membrane protein A and related proteins
MRLIPIAGLIAVMAVAASGAVVAKDGFSLDGPAKPAFIYYADKTDGGWVQSFDEARMRLEKELNLKIPYVENVGDNETEIRPAAEKFMERGYNVIIGTSFGYNDTFKALAGEHPNVAFLISPGTFTAPNVQGFYGRSYQAFYACGMAAGAMAKTGKLGFVGGLPTSVVIWNINAFELGAQKVNPAATVTVVYSGSWNDAAKERAAAEALFDKGIEVISETVNGPTTELVAQERGKYAVAHQRDKSTAAPKSVLCSSIWSWTGYLASEIKAIQAGGWKPSGKTDLPGFKEGGSDIVCCNAVVPAAVAEKVKAERAAIIAGKEVYAGPLSDRDGKERVAAGKVLDDGGLWAMDWYVKGVITQ